MTTPLVDSIMTNMTLETYEHAHDNDQPTTCPMCGSRTDFDSSIVTKAQHHICLDNKCKYEFLLEHEEVNLTVPEKWRIHAT